MKFTIELDDEQDISSIAYEAANEIANKLILKLNVEQIKKDAVAAFEAKKKESIEGMKMEVKSWDKYDLIMTLQQSMGEAFVGRIAEKVVKDLKGNSDFVANVSKEIIKSNFNK